MVKHKYIQTGNPANKLGLPYYAMGCFLYVRRMKSSQARAHLSEVTGEERQLILHSSENERK